jgi:hypothetical protein
MGVVNQKYEKTWEKNKQRTMQSTKMKKHKKGLANGSPWCMFTNEKMIDKSLVRDWWLKNKESQRA